MLKNFLFLLIFTLFVSLFSCSLVKPILDTVHEALLPGSGITTGEKILDPEGSLWEYKGNYPVVIGELSPTLQIRTAFVDGVEGLVMFIHKETIVHAKIGDVFILINPGAKLKAAISAQGFTHSLEDLNICNAVCQAVPDSKAGSTLSQRFCLLLIFD